MQITARMRKNSKGCFYTGVFKFRERRWYFEKFSLGIFMVELSETRKYSRVRFQPSIPKIPPKILSEIISYFQKNLKLEMIVQILLINNEFLINYPRVQYSTKDSVFYSFQIPIGALLVMTIHSHNTMPAFFSRTDNEDETITGLYGVVGCLDSKPQIRFRAAMGGSFGSIPIKKLFYEKEGDRTEMYGN